MRIHYQNLTAKPLKIMMRCFRRSIPGMFNRICLWAFFGNMFLRGYLLLDSSDMSMTWSNFLKSIFVWKCVFKNVILGKSVNATSTKHKREGACLKLLPYVDSILNIQIRSIKVICSMLHQTRRVSARRRSVPRCDWIRSRNFSRCVPRSRNGT